MPDEQPPIPTVASNVEERLDQLCALRATLAAQLREIAPTYKELENQLKTVADAIKLELARMAPGQPKVKLTSSHLRKPLLMANKVRRSVVDPEDFKAEQPALYNRFVSESPYYDLRETS